MTREARAACPHEDCNWSFQSKITAQISAQVADHYRETGHVAHVDRKGNEPGRLSICLDCGWTYHHGENVDPRPVTDHRSHGGNVLDDRLGNDPEGHEVETVEQTQLEEDTVSHDL